MEIVYHLGVHLTDGEQIQRTLLKNRTVLAAEGIVVPWPRFYRYVFRDLLNRLGGKKASGEMQDLILDGLMAMDDPRRVVFCNENFFCLRPQALDAGKFYPMAGERARGLRNIFPDTPVSFSLGIRNPATFVPALFEAVQPSEYQSFIGATDPARLAWSEMIARIRDAVPDAAITVWCNEDLPVLWPEVLRAVTGHDPETRLTNLGDLWGQLLAPEGLRRMQAYFADHPPLNDARRRRAVAAFLEKFGLPEQIEMEIDLPGWTEVMVEAITAAYEADLAEIARMPGVTLLT
jgi:hypothetical protein